MLKELSAAMDSHINFPPGSPGGVTETTNPSLDSINTEANLAVGYDVLGSAGLNRAI
jgi:hypothetical protein